MCSAEDMRPLMLGAPGAFPKARLAPGSAVILAGAAVSRMRAAVTSCTLEPTVAAASIHRPVLRRFVVTRGRSRTGCRLGRPFGIVPRLTVSLGRRRSNISCSSKPGGRSRHERRGAGRTVEIARFASILEGLAIRLPVLAVLGANGTCRVIAMLALVPAVCRGSPASLLVRVARERQATPVVILHDAVGRLQAEGLLALCCPGFNVPLGGAALISWWAESGKGKLLG